MTERFPNTDQDTEFTIDMLALLADVRMWERRVMTNRELLAFSSRERVATVSPLETERDLLLAQQALQAALWRSHVHFVTHRDQYIEAAQQECPIPLTLL